jgi:hypothetical protein
MRVYKYGALAPIQNADLVDEQMYRAHRYYNKLVELERARLDAVQRALATHPDVDPLKAAVDAVGARLQEALARIAREKSQGRTGKVAPELRQQVKDLRAEAKAARAALKETKTRIAKDPQVQAALDEAKQGYYAAVKVAHKASGLYWGSYLQVDNAFDAAKNNLKGQPPRFKSWTGYGHLAVQCQNGLPTEVVVGGSSTLVQIDAIPPEQALLGGHRRGRTRVRIRVGTVEGGKAPIFAELPMVLHRPLPPGRVMWVHLIRHPDVSAAAKDTTVRGKRGHGAKWEVHFVVDEDQPVVGRSGHGLASVNLGWRSLANGCLRLALLRDEFGNQEELRIGASVLTLFEKADAFRAAQDKLLDALKPSLSAWVGTLEPADDRPRPQDILLWRSPRRVSRLFRTHQELMPPDMRERTAHYLTRVRHLWQSEAAMRAKALRRRKEIYRLWAKEMAERYDTIAFEKYDRREVAQKGPAEEDARGRQGQQNRMRVAPSSFLDALVSAGARRGGNPLPLPAAHITTTCHCCGSVEDFDAAKELQHTCSACGATWDQDANAAMNLLARAKDQLPVLAGARAPETPGAAGFSARQRRLRGIREDPHQETLAAS